MIRDRHFDVGNVVHRSGSPPPQPTLPNYSCFPRGSSRKLKASSFPAASEPLQASHALEPRALRVEFRRCGPGAYGATENKHTSSERLIEKEKT